MNQTRAVQTTQHNARKGRFFGRGRRLNQPTPHAVMASGGNAMGIDDNHALERDRLRFDIDPDGTVEGADAELAATLRYVCRMGGQIGALLGLGEAEDSAPRARSR